MQIMDKAFQNATSLREMKIAERTQYLDRLEYTKIQMHELTDEVKHRIEQLVEQVSVSSLIMDDIIRGDMASREFAIWRTSSPLTL